MQSGLKIPPKGKLFMGIDDKDNTNAFGQSICKLTYSHHGWYCYGDMEILVSCRPFFAYAQRRITGKRKPGGNQGSAGKEVNWKRGAFAN